MARTLTEIFNSIKASYEAERATAGLAVDDTLLWSKVNLKRLIFYVVAIAIYLHEQIWEKQREEVNETIATQRPPTVTWYAQKALAYQHGCPFIGETDEFDNTGYTDIQVEASKVIKRAAIQRIKDEDGNILELRFKLAGETAGVLTELPTEVVGGFNVYLERFIAAGDNEKVVAKGADKLTMAWTVYYNPGLLNTNGSRKDGTAETPVKDAIVAFLKDGLQFNNEYSITSHIDFVQKVQGVLVPVVTACTASWDALPEVSISEFYQPDGGWLAFDDVDVDLTIKYIAK